MLGYQVKTKNQNGQNGYEQPVKARPGFKKWRFLVSSLLRLLGHNQLFSTELSEVFLGFSCPMEIMLVKIRKAPGTPAGSSLNQL